MKICIFTLALVINLLDKTSCERSLIKQNGDDLTLSCEVTDDDTVKWTENGVVISQTTINGEGNLVISTLERKNLTSEDTGLYQCLKRSDESIINNFTVTVISIEGENGSLPLQGNATDAELKCSVASGDIKVLSLQWKRTGESINETDDKFEVKTGDNSSSSLIIIDAETTDAGLYVCVVTVRVEDEDEVFERTFSLNTPATVGPIEKLRSRVEDEDARIECKVSGFPTPDITWYRQLEDEEDMKEVDYDERVNTTKNKDNVPNAILVIRKLKIKTDRGDYTCVASNFLGSANHTATLKVKDKLAAVWPFLGICAEVAILCSIIFIFEKRRNNKMEREEKVDDVKNDMLNQTNGIDEKDVRQRNNAAAAAVKA